MEAINREKSIEKIKYNINFKEQAADGLMTSEKLIGFLGEKLKVKNSNSLARKEVKYHDYTTSVEVEVTDGLIKKKDMKSYVRRFARSCGIGNYVKVLGGEKYEIKVDYVNYVDNAGEEDEDNNTADVE